MQTAEELHHEPPPLSSVSKRVPASTGLNVLLALTSLLCLTLGLHFKFLLWNFDDSLIVYRLVENLLAGNGWTYNLGELHNPSTSVLNTLLIVLGGLLGLTVPLSAHLVGSLGLFLAGSASYLTLRKDLGELLAWMSSALLIYFLAHSSTWGLETLLFAGLCISFIALERFGRSAWWLLGLSILTRPDAVLLAAFKWIKELCSKRTFSISGLLQIALLLSPWCIFSLITFGQLFPDTLSSKIWQGQSGYWGNGWIYLKALGKHILYGQALHQLVYLIAGIGWFTLAIRRHVLLYFVLFAILQQLAYIALNVPGYHWYFVLFDCAVLLGACYSIGIGVTALCPQILDSLTRVAFPVALGLSLYTAWSWSKTQPRDLRDVAYAAVTQQIEDENHPTGKLATLEVGTVGYHTKRSIVDMVGLTSTNPEYITGRNSDHFFANPPQVVLLHKPLWHFERALHDDVRFRIMYRFAGNRDDPNFAMQYFVLRDSYPELNAENIAAYLREHYDSFSKVDLTTTEPSKRALCVLDLVNGQLARGKQIAIPHTLLALRGWALVNGADSLSKDVTIVLHSELALYEMIATRHARPDVAAHVEQPHLHDAGFGLEGVVSGIPAGEYTVLIVQQLAEQRFSCNTGKILKLG